MSALPRPDVTGPTRTLNDALHDLHHRAGWPSLRTLARETGVSHTTVSKVFSAPALPAWGILELVVDALDGDAQAFHELWLAASSTDVEVPAPQARIAGRRAELDVVRRHLEAGSGLLLVTGEAGIGKTKLVSTVARRSRAWTSTGHCLPLSTGVPLLPVIDVLRDLHRREGGALLEGAVTACPAYVRRSLLSVLPELAPDEPAPAPDEWGRERLFTSLVTVLERLHERDVAVVVEDCHWADPTTLDFLLHLTTHPAGVPVVATWRSGDPDVPTDHDAWFALMRRSEHVETLALAPLTREETTEQLRLVTGAEPSGELVDRVFARSLGVPLYTAHLAGAPPTDDLPVPLADVLDERLGDLDGGAWQVARALGLAQRRLPAPALAAAAQLDEDRLPEVLRTLAHRRLLAVEAPDLVGLAHPLLVEAVGRRLLPGEAAPVHARLAEALDALPGIEPAEVAQHWRDAGRPAEEVGPLVRSARRAGSRFAHREALDDWLRVLDLWERGTRPDDTELWEVLADAVHEAVELGEVDAGRPLVERALALDLPPAARVTVLRRAAELLIDDGRSDAGRACLDEALALAESQETPEVLATLAARIDLLTLEGEFAEARADARRVLEMVQQWGDPAQQRRMMCSLGWLTMETDGHQAALDVLARARAVEVDEPDPMTEMMLAANTTDVLLRAASPAAEVAAAARDALARAPGWNLQGSFVDVIVRSNVAWAHLRAGDLRPARALLEPVTRTPPTSITAIAHAGLSAVELREGDVPGALRRSRAADAQVRNRGQLWFEAVPLLAETELWAGETDRAVRLLDAVLVDGLRGPACIMAAPHLVLLARAHGDRWQEHDDAAEQRRTVVLLRAQVAAAHPAPFGATRIDVVVPVLHVQWEAELARIQRSDAPGPWARAAEGWDEHGQPHEAAYCRWRAAQCALRAGQGTLAARLLRKAAADAREHVPLAQAIALTAAGAR
jgi:tetratricopeptide (TPR) repeat protein